MFVCRLTICLSEIYDSRQFASVVLYARKRGSFATLRTNRRTRVADGGDPSARCARSGQAARLSIVRIDWGKIRSGDEVRAQECARHTKAAELRAVGKGCSPLLAKGARMAPAGPRSVAKMSAGDHGEDQKRRGPSTAFGARLTPLRMTDRNKVSGRRDGRGRPSLHHHDTKGRRPAAVHTRGLISVNGGC
jgi:hypothetical protein